MYTGYVQQIASQSTSGSPVICALAVRGLTPLSAVCWNNGRAYWPHLQQARSMKPEERKTTAQLLSVSLIWDQNRLDRLHEIKGLYQQLSLALWEALEADRSPHTELLILMRISGEAELAAYDLIRKLSPLASETPELRVEEHKAVTEAFAVFSDGAKRVDHHFARIAKLLDLDPHLEVCPQEPIQDLLTLMNKYGVLLHRQLENQLEGSSTHA